MDDHIVKALRNRLEEIDTERQELYAEARAIHTLLEFYEEPEICTAQLDPRPPHAELSDSSCRIQAIASVMDPGEYYTPIQIQRRLAERLGCTLNYSRVYNTLYKHEKKFDIRINEERGTQLWGQRKIEHGA